MSSAVDASGNGHTGTYQNSPVGVPSLVVGDPDNAVSFAASPSDSYVVQDDTIGAQSFSAITLGCIIKPADPTDANEPTFFGLKGTNDNINFSANADGTITFFAKDGVGAINGFLLNSVTVLSTGSVYRLIGTWDGTTAKLWINGALDASVAYANAVNLAAAEKFFFGADQFDTTGNTSWSGVGDEAFFVANHAATGGEIATIDAAMTGTGSVVTAINALSPYVYWRLGDLGGGIILTAPLIFDQVREHLAVNLDFDWTAGTVKAVLVDKQTWTPNAGDDYVNTVLGAGAVETSGTRQTIGTPVANAPGGLHKVFWDGDPIVYPGVLVAETFDTLVLYRFVTNDTDSYLIAAYDLGAQVGDGSNVTLTPDTNGYVSV